MNKENTIFYIRYLQKKLYFRNSELIGAMFNLEKYLFDNFQLNQDVPTSLFKQKWIYDCIRNGDYSNEISKKFEVFEKKGLQNKILELFNPRRHAIVLRQNGSFMPKDDGPSAIG